MPRDSGGTYTLPAGNPVVSGTVIASSWANTTMDDMAIEMTDSLSRTGNGAMQAAFKAIDGAEASPSITFNNDPLTGRYLAAVGDMRDTVLGVDKMRYTAAGVEVLIDGAWELIAPLNAKAGRKNYLINGAMPEAQRGTSFTSDGYSLDRWNAGSVTFVDQVASDVALAGSSFAIRFGNSSAAFPQIFQRIEGQSCDSLYGKTVSVSFMAKAISGVSTLTLRLANADALDDYSTVTNIEDVEFGVPATDWTAYTAVIDLTGFDVFNGIQLKLQLNNESASGIEITNVQLEEGSSATAFEYVSPQANLAACQRYTKLLEYAQSTTITVAQAIKTTECYGDLSYGPMRAIPVVTLHSGTVAANQAAGSSGGGTLTFTQPSKDSVRMRMTAVTGLVVGNASAILPVTGDASILIAAEL